MDWRSATLRNPLGLNGLGRSGAVASGLGGGHAMTSSSFAAAGAPKMPATDSEYRPGTCNIGPAEIGRRRRAGHVGLLATLGLASLGIGVGIGVLAVLLPL